MLNRIFHLHFAWICNLSRITSDFISHSVTNTDIQPGQTYEHLRRDQRWGSTHDDVIKWKHLPRYWSFVWWIYRSPVNSRTKARKTRTQLCYVVNIMAADVLATKWARASVTIILTLLNRDNSVPASSGLKIKYLDFSLNGSHFLYVFIVYHFKSTTPFYAFPVDSAKNTNR